MRSTKGASFRGSLSRQTLPKVCNKKVLEKLKNDEKSTGRITWATFRIYVEHCGGPWLLLFVFLFTFAGSGA